MEIALLLLFLTRVIRVNLWLKFRFLFTTSEVGRLSGLFCELSLFNFTLRQLPSLEVFDGKKSLW